MTSEAPVKQFLSNRISNYRNNKHKALNDPFHGGLDTASDRWAARGRLLTSPLYKIPPGKASALVTMAAIGISLSDASTENKLDFAKGLFTVATNTPTGQLATITLGTLLIASAVYDIGSKGPDHYKTLAKLWGPSLLKDIATPPAEMATLAAKTTLTQNHVDLKAAQMAAMRGVMDGAKAVKRQLNKGKDTASSALHEAADTELVKAIAGLNEHRINSMKVLLLDGIDAMREQFKSAKALTPEISDSLTSLKASLSNAFTGLINATKKGMDGVQGWLTDIKRMSDSDHEQFLRKEAQNTLNGGSAMSQKQQQPR